MWYVVNIDGERYEFDKFAEAESFYDQKMRELYMEYEDYGIDETWEEYKDGLTISLLRVEQLMPIL